MNQVILREGWSRAGYKFQSKFRSSSGRKYVCKSRSRSKYTSRSVSRSYSWAGSVSKGNW
jgi:hypothetical protein